MQSKTCLPSIKYILDSPIDDASFSFPSIRQSSLINNNNNNVNISSYLPSISEPHHSSYKSSMNPSVVHHHHHHNNNESCFSSHSSIKSLLSPPESPDMTTSHQQPSLDNYGSTQRIAPHDYHSQNTRNHHHQPSAQSQPIVNHSCNCCVKQSSSTLPLIYPSHSSSHYAPYPYQYSQNHQHHHHHHQQQQRYNSSFPPTIQPIPISPFDRKQLPISAPTSSSLVSQPNATAPLNLTPISTIKLITPKPLHPSLSSSSSSSSSSNSSTASSNNNSGNRYQCQYCAKRFSRPSSLRIHTYSHTGEKPFVCSEPSCGRKFSVQSNMRRHLRVHRLGRPVKKTRYDGEVEGVKVLSPKILQSY